jgi:hypothetical protein
VRLELDATLSAVDWSFVYFLVHVPREMLSSLGFSPRLERDAVCWHMLAIRCSN